MRPIPPFNGQPEGQPLKKLTFSGSKTSFFTVMVVGDFFGVPEGKDSLVSAFFFFGCVCVG